ncbi:hypothetical protein A2U01_0076037, partial [Trifolium medium]|nr:hypothetical protein [Trifolium medium]
MLAVVGVVYYVAA